MRGHRPGCFWRAGPCHRRPRPALRRRRRPNEETLEADLVVDATGRTGRAAAWLPALGYARGGRRAGEGADQVLNPGLAVAPGCPWRQEAGHCRLVARLPAGPGDDRCRRRPLDRHGVRLPRASSASRSRGFLASPRPSPHPTCSRRSARPSRSAASSLTAFGRAGDGTYAAAAPVPAGLLAFGDAICGFNPADAEGISVAALQAVALRDALAVVDHEPARGFEAAAKPVDAGRSRPSVPICPVPGVEGPRPLPTRMINFYVDRSRRAAEQDIVLTERFFRVACSSRRPGCCALDGGARGSGKPALAWYAENRAHGTGDPRQRRRGPRNCRRIGIRPARAGQFLVPSEHLRMQMDSAIGISAVAGPRPEPRC